MVSFKYSYNSEIIVKKKKKRELVLNYTYSVQGFNSFNVLCICKHVKNEQIRCDLGVQAVMEYIEHRQSSWWSHLQKMSCNRMAENNT